MPGAANRCDAHVPRSCRFCNSDDDGKADQGPWHPCIEWWQRQPRSKCVHCGSKAGTWFDRSIDEEDGCMHEVCNGCGKNQP